MKRIADLSFAGKKVLVDSNILDLRCGNTSLNLALKRGLVDDLLSVDYELLADSIQHMEDVRSFVDSNDCLFIPEVLTELGVLKDNVRKYHSYFKHILNFNSTKFSNERSRDYFDCLNNLYVIYNSLKRLHGFLSNSRDSGDQDKTTYDRLLHVSRETSYLLEPLFNGKFSFANSSKLGHKLETDVKLAARAFSYARNEDCVLFTADQGLISLVERIPSIIHQHGVHFKGLIPVNEINVYDSCSNRYSSVKTGLPSGPSPHESVLERMAFG